MLMRTHTRIRTHTRTCIHIRHALRHTRRPSPPTTATTPFCRAAACTSTTRRITLAPFSRHSLLTLATRPVQPRCTTRSRDRPQMQQPPPQRQHRHCRQHRRSARSMPSDAVIRPAISDQRPQQQSTLTTHNNSISKRHWQPQSTT